MVLGLGQASLWECGWTGWLLSHSEAKPVDPLSKGSCEEAEYPRLTPKIECRETTPLSTLLLYETGPLAAHS